MQFTNVAFSIVSIALKIVKVIQYNFNLRNRCRKIAFAETCCIRSCENWYKLLNVFQQLSSTCDDN